MHALFSCFSATWLHIPSHSMRYALYKRILITAGAHRFSVWHVWKAPEPHSSTCTCNSSPRKLKFAQQATMKASTMFRTICVAILASVSLNMHVVRAQFVHRVAVEQDDVAIAPGNVAELPPAFCPGILLYSYICL